MNDSDVAITNFGNTKPSYHLVLFTKSAYVKKERISSMSSHQNHLLLIAHYSNQKLDISNKWWHDAITDAAPP